MDVLKLLRTVCLLVAVGIAAPSTTAAQESGLGGWDWNAEIYGWGANLGGKTTTGDKIEMSFDDIFDDLKFGAMGAVFAEKGNWLLFLEAFYLDIGDSDRVSASVGPIDVDVKGSFDLKGFQSTFAAGYKIAETKSTTLYATGGIRYLYLDGKVKVDARESFLGNPIGNQVVKDKESRGNWDAVIGLRGYQRFNEKWYMSYYADIGTGDSDLTWQATAGLFYRFEKAEVGFGYRYLDFDLDDFGPIDELKLKGPFVGVRFSF